MKFLVKENASYLVEQFRKVKVLSVLSDTELRTIVSQMRGFEFKQKFGPIENRKCYEIMHGRKAPCKAYPTFEAFETNQSVIS